jgi:hypothetical protein
MGLGGYHLMNLDGLLFYNIDMSTILCYGWKYTLRMRLLCIFAWGRGNYVESSP